MPFNFHFEMFKLFISTLMQCLGAVVAKVGLATGRSPVQVPERPSASEVSLSKALLPGCRS